MSRPIIEVENLSKLYRLGELGATSLREEIASKWRRWRGHERAADKKEFWALRDVSFSVQPGEVVGIIGRNGAGKSTLLKILSRITEPTTGRAVLRGRVASLLEVGTGFHPDLSGRDNIYLNGAILGMTRAEISKKFDEIVAFAEVEQFIDTPVKRYSSGMYVRLAFAVAAHLEPEILIVDEVLAVGDTAFQQKCLQKIQAISQGGRTVLFVSHNLSTLRLLCTHGVLLDHGRVAFSGQASATVDRYIGSYRLTTCEWRRSACAPESRGIHFTAVTLRNAAGVPTTEFAGDQTFTIELTLEVAALSANTQLAVRFTNHEGIPVFTTCNTDSAGGFVPLEPGSHHYVISVDASWLMPGRYLLKIAAHVPQSHALDVIDAEIGFTVHDTGNHINILKDNRLGVVCPVLPWNRA